MYNELSNNAGKFWNTFPIPNYTAPGARLSYMGLVSNLLNARNSNGLETVKQQLMSRKTIPVWDLSGQGVAIDQSGRIQMANNNGIYHNVTAAATEALLRGQIKPNGTRKRWEDVGQDNFTNGRFFFNSATFPVVMRWTEADRTRALPLSYRVCYSSWEPSAGKGPDTVLVHNPNWRRIALRPNQGSTQPVYVFLDITLLGDSNAILAVQAALENSFPVDNAYIYFYPEVADKYYQETTSPFHDRNTHKITGSSLGMATFAAVSGWPSHHYTGYISYIIPGYKMSNNPEHRQGISSAVQGTNPTYWNNQVPETTRIKEQYTVTAKAVVGIVKQLNFVETIQDIPMKIAYCNANGYALMFPASSAYGDSISAFLDRSDNKEYLRNILSMMPLVYTMSLAQDGHAATTALPNGQQFAANLFMGSTVTEFAALATIASYVNDMGARYLNTESIGQYQTFENAWTERKLQSGKAATQRFQQAREERKEIFEKYKDDPQQWIAATNNMKLQRKAKSAAKKGAKKKVAKEKSETRAAVRERLKQLEENYKNEYDQAKIALGPKPAKAAMSRFSKQWKRPAAVRRELLKKKIAEMLGTSPFMPRAMDTAKTAEGKRVSLLKRLKETGLDAAAAISVANKMFPNLSPLDPNMSGEQLNQVVVAHESSLKGGLQRPTYALGDTQQQQNQVPTNNFAQSLQQGIDAFDRERKQQQQNNMPPTPPSAKPPMKAPAIPQMYQGEVPDFDDDDDDDNNAKKKLKFKHKKSKKAPLSESKGVGARPAAMGPTRPSEATQENALRRREVFNAFRAKNPDFEEL